MRIMVLYGKYDGSVEYVEYVQTISSGLFLDIWWEYGVVSVKLLHNYGKLFIYEWIIYDRYVSLLEKWWFSIAIWNRLWVMGDKWDMKCQEATWHDDWLSTFGVPRGSICSGKAMSLIVYRLKEMGVLMMMTMIHLLITITIIVVVLIVGRWWWWWWSSSSSSSSSSSFWSWWSLRPFFIMMMMMMMMISWFFMIRIMISLW